MSTITQLESELAYRSVAAQPLDSDALKRSFAEYPSGITVVTAHTSAGPVGFTCQAFHSVSLEPPLVSLTVMNTSTTYPVIRDVGSFAVNVLGANQAKTAMKFASKSGDRWDGTEWSTSENGSPILDGSLAVFDCDLWAEYEAGDHTIVLGRVVGLRTSDLQPDPLVYFRSAFRALASSI